ncbi:MAG TPA: NUDIX hydrolase [Gemmataceae bacterium]|jgi:ADP-ribose pyrophosphatase
MRIRKVEQITHEKWLNLYSAKFEHNGHSGDWLYASRRHQPNTEMAADAVIVVPVLRMPNEPPRVVMVKEFRVPVGDYVFAFPAGLLDAGESFEDAARRELEEETGLEVATVHRVTQPLYSSSGLTDEAVAMVFVDAHARPETQQKLESSEDLQVVLLDFAGICQLIEDCSTRIEARAWLILHSYQILGHLP